MITSSLAVVYGLGIQLRGCLVSKPSRPRNDGGAGGMSVTRTSKYVSVYGIVWYVISFQSYLLDDMSHILKHSKYLLISYVYAIDIQ